MFLLLNLLLLIGLESGLSAKSPRACCGHFNGTDLRNYQVLFSCYDGANNVKGDEIRSDIFNKSICLQECIGPCQQFCPKTRDECIYGCGSNDDIICGFSISNGHRQGLSFMVITLVVIILITRTFKVFKLNN